MRFTFVLIAAALLAAAAPAAAQQPAERPPIRPLGGVAATSSESFGPMVAIRSLPDGRLLVNDLAGRRVIMLDSALAAKAVVADSTSATGNAYSARFAGLLAYRGDSTLFVDPQSLSMLVIDPAGKIGRVMSVPRSQDAAALAGVGVGAAAFDGVSRIVYRAGNMLQIRRGPGAGPAGALPEVPDTAAILRVDLATRVLDTVAYVKIPKVNIQMTQDDQGQMTIRREVNPLPTVDEWAMLPDGSVAIVRGRDYHIDWLRPDGTTASSRRIPFDWQRMTDEDKVAFIDSVKAARERMLAAEPPAAASAAAGAASHAAPAPGSAPGRQPGAPGEATVMTMRVGGPGGGVTTSGGSPQVDFVSPHELPDYRPPFFAGALRVDTEGNLWIRTTAAPTEQGASVYDVVNAKGELVDRVQVPAGRIIAAFGSNGAVYLTSRAATKTVLERAAVR